MTEAQFELLLAAIREQCKELHAIDDALGRLRGISYAVDIILCILAGLAGLALRDVHFSNRPSGSSAFRLSTAPVSMSLTGSRFSSDSAPRPLYGAF